MKKSTILMLVVIYIAAFFIVGLLGIQLRTHYHVDYLNEILITPFEESHLVETKHPEHVLINEGQEISEDKYRYTNSYEFKTTTNYSADMVLKFRVNLVPDNTTFSDYKLQEGDAKGMYKIEKGGDGTIFIKDIVVIGKRTAVNFTVEDLQNHGIKTDVTVYVYKTVS